MNKPFKRTSKGLIKIKLDESERAFMSNLFDDMSDIVMGDPKRLWRLFPPRYSDPSIQAAFELESAGTTNSQIELSGELINCRTLMSRSDPLSLAEADQLMRGLSKIRLVLGAIVGVNTDEFYLPQGSSKETELAFNIYNYLAWLVGEIIEELSS